MAKMHTLPVRFPKLDLHCHVDGAARPATLLELARQGGVPLPADSVEGLLPHVRVRADSRSLDEFLATFESFYPVLRAPGAMGRLACELVEDAAADGVLHLEARFCPALQAGEGRADRRIDGAWHSAHTAEDVLRETLAGLQAGAAATHISVGAIVCLYRSLTPAQNAELLRLALAYADRGVVGLDLAGPEHLPAAPLASLFRRAHAAGLPITVHAGEAAGPESVAQAVDLLCARRIGHGVALARDPSLARRVADLGIALECCLTSNLQTGAVSSLLVHPFETLRRAGLSVTLNTDDPSVCGTTLGREFELAAQQWDYTHEQLAALSMAAVEAAFVGAARRAELRAAVAAALVAAGVSDC